MDVLAHVRFVVCELAQHLVSPLGLHVPILHMSVHQISKLRPADSPWLPLIVRLQSPLVSFVGLVQNVVELTSQVGEFLSVPPSARRGESTS